MGVDEFRWRRQIEICRQELRDHVLSMQQDSSASILDYQNDMGCDVPKADEPKERWLTQNTFSVNHRLLESHKDLTASRNASLGEELSRLQNQVLSTKKLAAEVELSRDLAEARLFAVLSDLESMRKSPRD